MHRLTDSPLWHPHSRLIPNLFLRPHLLSTRKKAERRRQAKTAKPTATETWGAGEGADPEFFLWPQSSPKAHGFSGLRKGPESGP